MDTKKLRQKILDLAIRGKLVPQDPNDEPASVLLERIRAEKERLIAEGKIKRPKKSKASSSESHYQKFTPPFDLPDSWEWVRLGDISEIKGGTTIPTEQECSEGILPYIKVSDLNTQENIKEITTSNRYVNEWKESHVISKDSIVFPKRGGAIFTNKKRITRQPLLADLNLMSVHPLGCFEYVYLWFDSFKLSTIQSGSNIPQINNQDLEPLYIPLPPEKEQTRIVCTVSKLLDIIDILSIRCSNLFDKINIAKSKILELAMQGKLVPQDSADEPAADMLCRINPKAKIITDTPHYPLWVTTNLDAVCDFERGITFPTYAKEFEQTPENIACLRTANIQNEIDTTTLWFIDKKHLKGNTNKLLRIGDIIMSTANSKELVGRSVIVRELPYEMTFGGFVTVIRTSILDPNFLLLFIKYKMLKGELSEIATQTTNIANLTTKILSAIELSFPSIKEQRRIVEEVNRLYYFLEEIEASLQS